MKCDLCTHPIREPNTFDVGRPVRYYHVTVTANGHKVVCVDCCEKICVAVYHRMMQETFE